jgi:ABC-type transporter Mla MlaB component
MDPGCVLSVAGTLDRDSAVALDAEFEQLERSGCDDVVIDVSGLVQIDESGGVALAELWARMRTCGISCRIRGLHPVFGESPLELLLFLRNGVPLRREPGAGTRPWQMSRLVPRIS